jgi:hypothetical protein
MTRSPTRSSRDFKTAVIIALRDHEKQVTPRHGQRPYTPPDVAHVRRSSSRARHTRGRSADGRKSEPVRHRVRHAPHVPPTRAAFGPVPSALSLEGAVRPARTVTTCLRPLYPTPASGTSSRPRPTSASGRAGSTRRCEDGVFRTSEPGSTSASCRRTWTPGSRSSGWSACPRSDWRSSAVKAATLWTVLFPGRPNLSDDDCLSSLRYEP